MTVSLIKEFVGQTGACDLAEACERASDLVFPARLRSSIDLKVDPRQLSETAGIRIDYDSKMPFEGRLHREPDERAVITLGRRGSARRKRFTLAHELGHYIIQTMVQRDCSGVVYRWSSNTPQEVREEERLANMLAAELLMPKRYVSDRCGASTKKLEAVRSISKIFDVSLTAAIRRVADVSRQNYLLLTILPYKFDAPESIAEIDDAMFVTANSRPVFKRSTTKLVERIPFREFCSHQTLMLSLESHMGLMASGFELEESTYPLPNVTALTTFDRWPRWRREAE